MCMCVGVGVEGSEGVGNKCDAFNVASKVYHTN